MKDFAMNTEFILKFVGEHENFIIFIFTMLVIPGLKVFFKRPDFKSDIAEVRSIWDKKDEFDKYPNFIKDGVIKQISVLRFLDYRTFKILCSKELGYFDIITINQSLRYNSFYKLKVTHIDDKVEFSLHKSNRFCKWIIEKPKRLKRIIIAVGIILIVISSFLFTLDLLFINIITTIILISIEIFSMTLIADLDNTFEAKKILDSEKLFVKN